MTLAKCVKIVGHEVSCTCTPDESVPFFEYTAFNRDGSMRAIGVARTIPLALERLVDCNYKIVSDEVMRRAKGRCENCGALKPLQVHHKQFRSHGRVDLPSNLVAVCQSCHQVVHGIPTKGY